MPVQIPKLNRFEPQQTQSVGRSEIQAPNLAAIAQPQMNAVMNIAEQQTAYFQKQEDNAIDTAAKAAANEYNIYLNQELNKARQFQGDPTKVYAQFDEMRASKYEEILNKNPDISERGKSAIAGELSQVASNYQIKKDTAYAGQYYDYDKKVTQDSANLKSQDLMTAASYVDPTNPESFRAIDALINGIAIDYKNHGEKFGAVSRDEAGNQMATDGINLQIGETVSKGLVSAINNLNDSGRPDVADAVYAKYYKYIDSAKQDDVLKGIRSEQRLIKVLSTVPSLVGKDSDQVDRILNKEFKNDPIGKEKAYQALSSRINKKENIEQNIAKESYSRSYNRLSQVMNSKNPYANSFDLENDPVIRKEMDKMTPAQIQSLKKMIKAPDTSNITVKNKFYTSFANGELKGMSPETLNESIAGMNKSDRTKAETLWKKYNAPETTAEEVRMMNNVSSKLVPQLQAVGYVKRNSFNKYSNADQIKITQAQDELIAEMEKLPSTASYKDQLEFIKQFAATKKKQDTFKSDSGWFSFGGSSGSTEKPKTTESPFTNTKMIDDRERKINATRQFFREKKRSPNPGTNELQEYMEQKGL